MFVYLPLHQNSLTTHVCIPPTTPKLPYNPCMYISHYPKPPLQGGCIRNTVHMSGKFLYSAVSSPQDCSKRLDFTSLADLFNQTPSQLLWEASSRMLQLIREGCSYTYPPLSIARYSLMELSELKQCTVKNVVHQKSNLGSLSRESEALPVSHCALHTVGTRYSFPPFVRDDYNKRPC